MLRKQVNKRKTPAKARKSSVRINWQMPVLNWRLITNGTLLLGLVGSVYFATLWVLTQPINSVRIESSFERVSALQVEAAITPYIDQGFLSADLATLQRAIGDLPWVAQASVRRSWPSTLLVEVTEEHAAAVWQGEGLLNIYGELFVAQTTHIPAELPRLSGPKGAELRVAKKFFELDTLLKQRGLTADALKLDERGAWEVSLRNGMKVRFGAVAVDARTERFFHALDSVLTPMIDQVDYIDMRYTNGFAIGWKLGSKIKLAERRGANPNV